MKSAEILAFHKSGCLREIRNLLPNESMVNYDNITITITTIIITKITERSFTCSKLTIEMLEHSVKFVLSLNFLSLNKSHTFVLAFVLLNK